MYIRNVFFLSCILFRVIWSYMCIIDGYTQHSAVSLFCAALRGLDQIHTCGVNETFWLKLVCESYVHKWIDLSFCTTNFLMYSMALTCNLFDGERNWFLEDKKKLKKSFLFCFAVWRVGVLELFFVVIEL